MKFVQKVRQTHSMAIVISNIGLGLKKILWSYESMKRNQTSTIDIENTYYHIKLNNLQEECLKLMYKRHERKNIGAFPIGFGESMFLTVLSKSFWIKNPDRIYVLKYLVL